MEKLYYAQKSLFIEVNLPIVWLVLLLSFGVLFSNESTAQTTCATALPITVNGGCITGSISVNDSSQDAPIIGSCPGNFRRERWYTFTVAGGTSNVTISASASNNNLFLQLISATGPCTGLSQIECGNVTSGNSAQTETITSSLVNGTYYIKVVNVGSNSDMTLTNLCVTAPPVISSLGSSSGCVGSSITINGANFTGATAANVRIGGTAVSSITSNTGTVIVAVVGSGTTGTVSVTTAPGTATSAGTFTINQLPVVTHVRLNIFPDGGISRLRLFGKKKA